MLALLRCQFLSVLFSGGLTCSPVLSNPPASAFLLLEIKFCMVFFLWCRKKIQVLYPLGKVHIPEVTLGCLLLLLSTLFIF